MRPIFVVTAAASLLMAGAALAQAPAQSTPTAKPSDAPAATAAAPAAAAAANASVSDAELKKFAGLAKQVKGIMEQHQPAIAAAADPAAKSKEESSMSGELQVAVTDAGFTVQRYNEIAQAMQKDPTLFQRMQQLSAGG